MYHLDGLLVRSHSGACFIINFTLMVSRVCLAQFSLNNGHKGGLKQHHFVSFGVAQPVTAFSSWTSPIHHLYK